MSSPSVHAVDVEGLDFELVAVGLDSPVAVTHAGDERLFITLQDGRIVILNADDQVRAQPFLDIRDRVSSGGERGLLSVAFHPDYSRSGFFFVNYTDNSGDTVVARYSVTSDRNVADPSSEAVLLEIGQPFPNHNGGQLQFGPDGFLYVATGDGGSGNDPQCRAQNTSSLLGKMLRLDVDQNVDTAPFHAIPPSNPFVGTAGVRDEIWALGLRNPWRFSFDRSTGDLYVADVGQNAFEEVDFQSAASGGGENYGWKMMEGFSCTNNSGGCASTIPPCDAPEYTPPAFDYDHNGGRCSITGGYVYRGNAIPQAAGAYFYGDFCSGEVWAAERQGNAWRSDLLAASAFALTSFGEDSDGELYLTAAGGNALYRLTGPSGGGGGDCDLAAGDPRFCDVCGPCGEGEGGCRGDDQCGSGLTCAEDFGARFGLARTVDVCLTPKSLAPPPYALTTLSAPAEFEQVRGAAINNAGQVVGHLVRGAAGADTVAFRTVGGSEVEILDPVPSSSSRAVEVNDGGGVFGVLRAADGSEQTGFFLYEDAAGFDLLGRGATAQLRRTFAFADMNESGEVVGSAARRATGRQQPYLYTASEGWIDLAALDPRFRQVGTRIEHINDSGDLVLNRFTTGIDSPVTHETYLLHGDQTFELGDFGIPINLPAALNRAGRVVGTAWSAAAEQPHAYVYSGPGGRLIDIHPPRFARSAAVHVTAKGIVGGTIASDVETDTLFLWDNRRERKMRLQARAVDFSRLLEDDEHFFLIDGVRMNERLEFVGRLVATPGNPDLLFQRWFYYSPATGLLDVEDLLAGTGAGETVLEVADINDRGALLLHVESSAGAESAVVLTPMEE